MADTSTHHRWTPLIGVVLLALIPPVAGWLDQPYLVSLFNRAVIFAIAVIGLDLILGFGGMVSFGHAAFLGVGGYVAGILAHHAFEESAVLAWPFTLMGTDSALVLWPAAAAGAAVAALVIGAICLRTGGVYFIMITLAFAQMLFFLAVSFQRYGGEDGLSLFQRSTLPGLDLGDDTTFYDVCLFLMAAYLFLCFRIVGSRFGWVVRGCRQNEDRMRALGFATYRYKLVCFVIAGAGAGLSGALMVDLDSFVSPALLAWTRSGELLIMVILGGMSTLFGPVLGAIALLLLEEVLGAYTEHWMAILGPILILLVLVARRGLCGLIARRRHA